MAMYRPTAHNSAGLDKQIQPLLVHGAAHVFVCVWASCQVGASVVCVIVRMGRGARPCQGGDSRHSCYSTLPSDSLTREVLSMSRDRYPMFQWFFLGLRPCHV